MTGARGWTGIKLAALLLLVSKLMCIFLYAGVKIEGAFKKNVFVIIAGNMTWRRLSYIYIYIYDEAYWSFHLTSDSDATAYVLIWTAFPAIVQDSHGWITWPSYIDCKAEIHEVALQPWTLLIELLARLHLICLSSVQWKKVWFYWRHLARRTQQGLSVSEYVPLTRQHSAYLS